MNDEALNPEVRGHYLLHCVHHPSSLRQNETVSFQGTVWTPHGTYVEPMNHCSFQQCSQNFGQFPGRCFPNSSAVSNSAASEMIKVISVERNVNYIGGPDCEGSLWDTDGCVIAFFISIFIHVQEETA